MNPNDEPSLGAIYVVSELQHGELRKILTTSDKTTASALLKELADRGRLEVFPPNRR